MEELSHQEQAPDLKGAEVDSIPVPCENPVYRLKRFKKKDMSLVGEQDYSVDNHEGVIQKGQVRFSYPIASGNESRSKSYTSTVEKIVRLANGSYAIICEKSVYMYTPGRNEPEMIQQVDEIPANNKGDYRFERIAKRDHRNMGNMDVIVTTEDNPHRQIRKGRIHIQYFADQDGDGFKKNDFLGRSMDIQDIQLKSDGSYWIYCGYSIYIYKPDQENLSPRRENKKAPDTTGSWRKKLGGLFRNLLK